jgi:hypothetical protein
MDHQLRETAAPAVSDRWKFPAFQSEISKLSMEGSWERKPHSSLRYRKLLLGTIPLLIFDASGAEL